MKADVRPVERSTAPALRDLVDTRGSVSTQGVGLASPVDSPTPDLLVARLLTLHRVDGSGLSCVECDLPWECNTVQIINGKVPFALEVAGWS